MRLFERANVSQNSIEIPSGHSDLIDSVNRTRRLADEHKSLFKIPPDAAESTIIHDLFLKVIKPG